MVKCDIQENNTIIRNNILFILIEIDQIQNICMIKAEETKEKYCTESKSWQRKEKLTIPAPKILTRSRTPEENLDSRQMRTFYEIYFHVKNSIGKKLFLWSQ